jgi:hypothetical protein
MISPWEIYWVMQLDTINNLAGFASFIGLFGMPFMWGFILSETDSVAVRVAGSGVTAAWVLALALVAFLPSSKTAAAMIVIPAIANNERFQSEASDLYQLAKQGLQKLVADDQEKKPATE